MNDYLYILVTLLIGLSITDMIVSTHRLLVAGDIVRWHWMTATLSLIMLMQLLGFWWLWFGMYDNMASISVAQFLPDLAILVLLFLACATALPNEVPVEGIDLEQYYYDRSRLFWSLFALYVVVATIFIPLRFVGQSAVSTMILYNLPNVALAALAVSLSRTRKPWAHKAALVILLPYTIIVQSQMVIRAAPLAAG